jgi:hypothetical protein
LFSDTGLLARLKASWRATILLRPAANKYIFRPIEFSSN